VINTALRRYDVTQTEAQRGFRADLRANYGINRNDEVVRNVFQDFNQTRSVVLTFTVPIWDWGSNATAVEASEANLKNAELDLKQREIEIKQDIIDILNRIKVAKSRLLVTQKGEELAKKSYDISLARFKVGQIKSDELVQEQRRLTEARINNLTALIDYKVALSDLKRRTLFDFEKNEPVKVKEGGA
jgi:outer membrane protein TolC